MRPCVGGDLPRPNPMEKLLKFSRTSISRARALAICGAFIALPVLASAAQVSTITIQNGATQTINLYYNNSSGTWSPALPTPLAAGANGVGVLTSISNSAGAGTIRYQTTSGGKACEFGWSASLIGSTWTFSKRATSIGSTSATCTATLTSVNNTNGNMSVTFKIQ